MWIFLQPFSVLFLMWYIKFWNCFLPLCFMLWISLSAIKYKSSFWLEWLQSSLLNWCVLTYWTNLLLINIWWPHFLSGSDKAEVCIMSMRVCVMQTFKDSKIILSSDYLKIHFQNLYSNIIFSFVHCSFMFINWYSKVPIVCRGVKQVQRREL